ncbi:MAG: type IV toxin-antitoxin system AbiEi family antitoxin domain-containing protein [Nitrospirae bacterium]|nr:type IV toxin-antitoxin system AbiEi family antitoxin domain-containing protein [Nitrospirota bacterium]
MKSIELIKTLERINKPFYSIADIEKITSVSRKSAYVTLNRLVEKGILERLSTGIYRLFSAKVSVEKIAGSLYLPNYLSFESALSRHGILNLVPYTLTFATTRKTKRSVIEGRDVEFRQIKKDLFWGYEVQDGIYVAKPEKAFLDLVYLASRGIASIDLDELNLKKLSMTTVKEFSKRYPEYTRVYLSKLISRT